MLDTNPLEEERELLEVWLMGYAFFGDTDRVTLYWKPFLYGDDFGPRMTAMNRLFILSKRNVLANNILIEYLGEEPTEESLRKKHLSHFDEGTDGKYKP